MENRQVDYSGKRSVVSIVEERRRTTSHKLFISTKLNGHPRVAI